MNGSRTQESSAYVKWIATILTRCRVDDARSYKVDVDRRRTMKSRRIHNITEGADIVVFKPNTRNRAYLMRGSERKLQLQFILNNPPQQ